MRLCRSLRWKGFYGATFPDRASVERALTSADAPFSCVRTCQPWGPDEQPSWPEACQPGRGCFRPSPKDPDAPSS